MRFEIKITCRVAAVGKLVVDCLSNLFAAIANIPGVISFEPVVLARADIHYRNPEIRTFFYGSLGIADENRRAAQKGNKMFR